MTTQPYVLCVTLNPVLDTSYFVDEMRPVYRTQARRVTHVAGGKGNNVSRGLALLGETAHSLVTLGGMIGRNVAEVLESDAFSFTPVWVQGETRLQITAIDAKGVQRAFYAPTAEFKAEDAAAAGRAFDALLPDARAVCLCGSSPGPAADPLYNRFIRSARERGILTVLDSYGDALREGLAAQPHLVKVNASEAAGPAGRPLPDQAAQIDAVAELREAGAAIAVLTLGESGALLATNEFGECLMDGLCFGLGLGGGHQFLDQSVVQIQCSAHHIHLHRMQGLYAFERCSQEAFLGPHSMRNHSLCSWWVLRPALAV